MDSRLAEMLANLSRNPRARMGDIEAIESKFGFCLPQSYVDYMLESNGGEGSVGDSYLALWSSDEVIQLNDAAAVSEFAPGLVLFGSNGGDTAYAFDIRSGTPCIVDVPLVGLDLSQARPRGGTFTEFVEHLATRA